LCVIGRGSREESVIKTTLTFAMTLPVLLACGTSDCGATQPPPAQSAAPIATAGSAAPPPATAKPETDQKATALLPPAGEDSATPSTGRQFTFDTDVVGKPPAGFAFERTGGGAQGHWTVRAEKDAPSAPNVLAQLDTDMTDYRFPVAIAEGPPNADFLLSVRCKPVSGNVDRACGLVFRFADENNYYVARANALENNVRLYHVVRGQRVQFAGWNGPVASSVWHELRVEAKGDHFQVTWDQKKVIDARDGTFVAAGKVGVWTKADSVTYFDDLKVEPVPQ
jgi:hypothetical protein